jgi:hypothetical protein
MLEETQNQKKPHRLTYLYYNQLFTMYLWMTVLSCCHSLTHSRLLLNSSITRLFPIVILFCKLLQPGRTSCVLSTLRLCLGRAEPDGGELFGLLLLVFAASSRRPLLEAHPGVHPPLPRLLPVCLKLLHGGKRGKINSVLISRI